VLVVADSDFEDQLCEIARLEQLSQCEIRNEKGRRSFAMKYLAVFKAPTISDGSWALSSTRSLYLTPL
jgi:hypothetical protein